MRTLTCPDCGAELHAVHLFGQTEEVPACENCARLALRRELGLCRICPEPSAKGCDHCAKHCLAVPHPRCERANKREYMRLYMRGYYRRPERQRGAA